MVLNAHMDNRMNVSFFGIGLNCSVRLISILLFHVLLFISSSAWSRTDSVYVFDGETILATVNEHPLTIREYENYLEQSRTDVISDFIRKYNLNEISPSFWEQDFNGIKAFDHLKEIALRKAIDTKIKLVYMHEAGVIDSPDYKDFLKKYNDFCKERSNAGNENIKYGPVHFSEGEFFNYWFSNSLIEIKNKIYYENEPCIPTAPGNEMQARHHFSSINSDRIKNTRKDEEEIENIFRERIQRYESNAEIKINHQLLKDITPSF